MRFNLQFQKFLIANNHQFFLAIFQSVSVVVFVVIHRKSLFHEFANKKKTVNYVIFDLLSLMKLTNCANERFISSAWIDNWVAVMEQAF